MFVFSMGMFAGGLISIYSGSGAVIGYSQVDIFAVLMRGNMCRWDLCSAYAFERIVEGVEGLGSKWTHENVLEDY